MSWIYRKLNPTHRWRQADIIGRSMDDSNSLGKEEITRDLYNIDQFIDFCFHPRRARLGSHCQLDVYLGSCNSDVCGIV
jgi:hypothetical protein